MSEPTCSLPNIPAPIAREKPWVQLKTFTSKPAIFRSMVGEVSPDARQGDVAKLSNIPDIFTLVVKAPDSQHMSDLDACADWAANHGGDGNRLGITGFCRGGRTVWLYAAHNPRLNAGVAWYGSLDAAPTPLQPKSPVDLAGELKAPGLGLYAGQDQGIPLDQVEDMREGIKKAGGKSGIHVYPDVPHAFHADYRPSYRKEAAEDGWQRMLAWFKQNGLT